MQNIALLKPVYAEYNDGDAKYVTDGIVPHGK